MSTIVVEASADAIWWQEPVLAEVRVGAHQQTVVGGRKVVAAVEVGHQGAQVGVGQPQRGAAEHQPPIDTVQLAQGFDVADHMLGGERGQAHVRVAGQGPASTTSALVEQRHVVPPGVEVGAPPRRRTGTGPPWSTTAGLPCGFPTRSQLTRCPSATSKTPCAKGSMAGCRIGSVSTGRSEPVLPGPGDGRSLCDVCARARGAG